MEMNKQPLPPNVCAPTLHIGAIVNYTDHKGKEVQGKILSATCIWEGRGNGAAYTLKYALTHPTHPRRQHHTIGDIISEVE